MFSTKGYKKVRSEIEDIAPLQKVRYGSSYACFCGLTPAERAIVWWANHTHRVGKVGATLIVSTKVIKQYTG